MKFHIPLTVCTNLLFVQIAWSQDQCQQALTNMRTCENNARHSVGVSSEVARFNECAQVYRNYYNQYCVGGNTTSGGSSDYSNNNTSVDIDTQRLQGAQQILQGLAGIAQIMENRRQREEEEARQQQMELELQRLEEEQRQAEQNQKAAREEAARKVEDDRQRKTLPNPFETKSAKAVANPFSRTESDVCIEQQLANITEFKRNARQCLLNTQLIASFDGEPLIEGNSDSEMWGRFVNARPRWVINGTRATPVCSLPLKVDSQYESFAECARVNLCAVRAAKCTIRALQHGEGGTCNQLASACLESYPVPQTLAETETVPRRTTSAIVPSEVSSASRIRPSGISGPSGRGSGGLESSTSAK